MNLHYDNEDAHNPIQHYWTKHMEVDRHFMKKNFDHKVVSWRVFHGSIDKLGIIDIYASTSGTNELFMLFPCVYRVVSLLIPPIREE